MATLFITGAPGWVGTRLVRAVTQGIPDLPAAATAQTGGPVRCLVLPGQDTRAIRSLGAEICEGDLRSADQARAFCQGIEGATLVHCAGLIHPRMRVRDLYEVNVEGTRNLLQAAEAAGARRVVVLSSNSPFGANPAREHRFTEESPYHPYMNYGRSKMQMEQVVREVQSRGRLETVILRPTWFYGPDQPERQTTFFSMIKNGSAPILGDGGNLRSMVYIDNLCQAILLAAGAERAAGQAYWVADPRPYSMNEITDTVERLMEKEFGMTVAHKRLRLPAIAGDVAQVCDALIQATGLYQQKVHVLSEMNKTIACSIEKACRELGYAPAVELEEGMRRSLAWCVERGIKL